VRRDERTARIGLIDFKDHLMAENASRTHCARRTPCRSGKIKPYFVVAMGIIGVGVAVLLATGRKGDNELALNPPLTDVVKRGPYKHEVIEQGEVESSNNVEIRCELRARSVTGPSTSIIDVVREGTQVQKGDWLITFDSSTLELERSQQRILVNTSEALVIQTKAVYETAVIAKKEYLEGAYRGV
jgi:multidrug efflux pump subunit AcrA (membrane-fusion protein)